MTDEDEGLRNELANIVRGCTDSVVAGAPIKDNPDVFSLNPASSDELHAWTQYELDLLASAVENAGVPKQTPVMCGGVDLFHAKEGHVILAPAVAAESLVYMAGGIVDIIREHFKTRPAQMDAAINLFVKAVTPYIMVNANSFITRIEEGIALLGRAGQMHRSESLENAGSESQGGLFDDDGLTPREELVVRLVALGKSNGEIASELQITQNTVKNHMRHILEKTGLENRVQLGVYAIQKGVQNG